MWPVEGVGVAAGAPARQLCAASLPAGCCGACGEDFRHASDVYWSLKSCLNLTATAGCGTSRFGFGGADSSWSFALRICDSELAKCPLPLRFTGLGAGFAGLGSSSLRLGEGGSGEARNSGIKSPSSESVASAQVVSFVSAMVCRTKKRLNSRSWWEMQPTPLMAFTGEVVLCTHSSTVDNHNRTFRGAQRWASNGRGVC